MQDIDAMNVDNIWDRLASWIKKLGDIDYMVIYVTQTGSLKKKCKLVILKIYFERCEK